MGKIVLYLADGTTLDIRLARERITIGRRADNDVCLLYPAVSGEHAAIVTILSDSFLEDLASTNGTLVNGKPIAKHFLRDRDQIDIDLPAGTVLTADDLIPLRPCPPEAFLPFESDKLIGKTLKAELKHGQSIARDHLA